MSIILHNHTMDFDAIAVFVKVVEAGSFSGAARLLGMPKTTVSAKVAALEKRLGTTLIQRTTRKLHVTEAGQTYFRHCAIALREVEQAESALLSAQETPRGLLRISAPVDVSHSVLPGIIAAYLKRYPMAEVALSVSNRVVDLVGEGIDLAIRAGELKDSTLVARRFFDIEAALWAAPAYLKRHGMPEHPKELARHLVIAHAGLKRIALSKGKAQCVVTPSARVTVDDLETIKALVGLGEGIGWLPRFLVAAGQEENPLVQVLPEWRLDLSGAFSFVYPGQKYASPKVRAFIDTAIEMTG